jgi:TldD protein
MLSKKLAKEILNTCLTTGGDFAEIFYEEHYNSSISLEGDKVDSAGDTLITGVGIRILNDLRSVYGHTNDLSRKNLLQLASNLSKSFEGKQIINVERLRNKKFKLVNQPIESYKNLDKKVVISTLKKCQKIISEYDKRIVRVVTGFNSDWQDITIFNSDGFIFNDHREHGRLFLQSVASENGKIETRFDGPGTQKGWEFFIKDINLDELSKNHAKKLILMLGAKECPSGTFPVIIGNGWGGVIFHEACGHQLEASSVAKKLSVFSNSYNTKIANPIVSAYDDGTMPNEWGSNNIDDEGQPCKKNLLISKGVLKGYLIDPFNARRMPGFKPNGCSRRQSYKFEPTSRMTNTYIAPGESTPEEIIKNTKLAIYAVSFNGGSVNPATGEFNFGCSEAYLVRDGKIVMPLRGATLIGKATEILKHIDMVGNDVGLGQGMCGASSGSIPVNVGQPTIRIDEIVVGGRGGNIDELK